MKILVPTDFSIYSEKAIETAIQLCANNVATIQNTIHLFHSFEASDYHKQLDLGSGFWHEFENRLYSALDNQLIKQKQLVEKYGIKCEIHLQSGKLQNTIKKFTEKYPIDLIVMGSHGNSANENSLFLGSNTQKVVRELGEKVLVVKKDNTSISFKNAVFVTGLEYSSQADLNAYLEFLLEFNLEKIHLLTIDYGSFFSQPSILINETTKDFESIIKKYPIDYEVHFLPAKSVKNGVDALLTEHQIGIIGVSTISRNPIKSFFYSSNIDKLIRESRVPLLCL